MGTWGAGLYASDLAMDLRTTVTAVLRLPLAEQRLVEILRQTQPECADDPADEEHTIFWLVLADQFEKRGVVSAEVRGKALEIIGDGQDLRVHKELGLTGAALRKRAATLDDLRQRILAGPNASLPRKVLRKPQPFLLEEGGLYIYPTLRGLPINPYLGPAHFDRAAWRPDGYGAILVAERGRAFDYLAWYRPLVAVPAFPSQPDMADLCDRARWAVAQPGTLSAAHFKRMEIERVGAIALSKCKVEAVLGRSRLYIACTVADISISNGMSLAAGVPALANQQESKPWYPVIEGLRELQD